MKHKLIFTLDLANKLDNISTETRAVWTAAGLANKNDVMNECVKQLNITYPKLNISEFEFRNTVSMYGESSTYFGVLENEIGIKVAYVFIIPPKYETRSGVLAQQVFPVLSGIMQNIQESKDYHISNKPIYVINVNEVRFTAAMAINILSGKILNFGYVDIFNRNINDVLISNGLNCNIKNINDYDILIQNNSREGINEFFSVDHVNKKISFLPTRLKDGIHVNNEPYWFVLKAYTAIYLANKEKYAFDMTEFDILLRGNKTLDAFRNYIEKFKLEG